MLLNGVSTAWLQRFVKEAAELQTGYRALYMLVSTFIIILTVYHLARRTAFREKLNIVSYVHKDVEYVHLLIQLSDRRPVLRYRAPTLDQVNS